MCRGWLLRAGLALRGTAAAQDTDAESNRRVLIGVRARYFPIPSMSVMGSRTDLATTTSPAPVRDWSFDTASQSNRISGGPRVEILAGRKWKFSVEVLFDRLKYTKFTSAAWGTDDPATTNDERSHMFRSEDTRASLWDVPVLAQYHGFGAGRWSKFYLTGGAALRTITGIHSSLLTTYPDTSTATLKYSAAPSKRNLIGGVIGAGFQIVDDFKIHWTPEVRYTRWAGSTFGSDSTVSPRNQLEVGLGFTF